MTHPFGGITLSLTFFLLLNACSPEGESGRAPNGNQDARIVAPYGSWASPLGAADVYEQSDNIAELQSVGGAICFAESEGTSGGRVGIKRLEPDGRVSQSIPAAFNVGTKVHEYGGAAFLGIGQSLFVSKKEDQLFYRFAPNQPELALTPNGTRHADCISYPKGSRIICVREDHRGAGEAKASLVTINLNFPGEGDTLVSGHDFIAAPTLSQDNSQLAWLTWEHPDMPWDNTVLWLGQLDRKGQLQNVHQVFKGKRGALTQPLFSPDGTLYVVADFNNWWNIYRIAADGTAENILPRKAEFAVPDWRLGHHNYAFESPGVLIASFTRQGEAFLARIHLDTGVVEQLAADFAEISQVISGEDAVYFVGAKTTPERGIYKVTGRGVELMYAPQLPRLKPEYVSKARAITFATAGNKSAYGYFYAPVNPHFIGPHDSRPPLLVMLHGGPTAKASLAYRSDIQFWTSRGFAVLDVNYRGSSGFGRKFRQSLYGLWGKADVEDAVYGARYLVDRGWVDGDKLAIRGSSAGGLTALSSLAFYDVFKAGVSYGGISDMTVLAKETHKFESHYLEKLVGPYPEAKDLYHARSPLHHLQGLNEPLLLVQGLDDKVVPPSQSMSIFNALKRKGVPTAFVGFEGDGTGFWRTEDRTSALEAELSFYGQVFGFRPAGELPGLQLENAGALKHKLAAVEP
ncbi:S9 family peptidase [Shewanella salipaludis]|uniref:S9 family peptidase n=1 Tax=Shewanella salipaludis TaxID=2723052 RepID=A0A972JLX3_9GAMM|nr:prolyl oligopeptidase family serine peptidase [Shewanella salipaludis]NMH64521.1 S9 family peptidase [Shewanella salipaludis]